MDGTLGCFALTNDKNEPVALSNHHVMYANASSAKGSPVYRHDMADFCADMHIGDILDGERGPIQLPLSETKDDPSKQQWGIMDAAICSLIAPKTVEHFKIKNVVRDLGRYELVNGIETFIPGDGEIQGVPVAKLVIGKEGDEKFLSAVNHRERVRKVGNTTNLTFGKIAQVDTVVRPLDMDKKTRRCYKNVMSIWLEEGKGTFCEKGDSGSVIVNTRNEVVGLLFSGGKKEGPEDSDTPLSYAAHIFPVLDRFNISIYKSPVAVLKHTVDPQNPLTIHFDASESRKGEGDLIVYLWRTGEFDEAMNELMATGPTFSHTYSQPGTYLVTLSVVGDYHMQSYASVEIVIPGAATLAGKTEVQFRAMTAAVPDTPWQKLAQSLQHSQKGTVLVNFIKAFQEEIRRLIYHNRQVTVTWQRKLGPYFFRQWMAALDHPEEPLVKEINGVHIQTLLESMAVVLEEAGSPALREAIGRHSLDLFNAVHQYETLGELRRSLLKE
jgi:hypothetical protein